MDAEQEQMSPVQEVAMHLHRQKVRREIQSREGNVLFAMRTPLASYVTQPSDETPVQQSAQSGHTEPVTEPVIDLSRGDDSDDSEETMDYDTTAANAFNKNYEEPAVNIHQTRPPGEMPHAPIVPKTVQQLWQQIKAIQATGCLDAPRCICSTCPYSSGPLMQQRHVLFERIVELERMLYGV